MNKCPVCSHTWDGTDPCPWCKAHRQDDERQVEMREIDKVCSKCRAKFVGTTLTLTPDPTKIIYGLCPKCQLGTERRAPGTPVVLAQQLAIDLPDDPPPLIREDAP